MAGERHGRGMLCVNQPLVFLVPSFIGRMNVCSMSRSLCTFLLFLTIKPLSIVCIYIITRDARTFAIIIPPIVSVRDLGMHRKH